jgi:hypothetical protein
LSAFGGKADVARTWRGRGVMFGFDSKPDITHLFSFHFRWFHFDLNQIHGGRSVAYWSLQ